MESIPILVWGCPIHSCWVLWNRRKHYFNFDSGNKVCLTFSTFNVLFHLVIFLARLSLICFYLLIQRNAKVLFQPPASDIVLYWFGVHLMLFTSAYISYIWTWKLVLCQKLPIHFIPIYGCFLYRKHLHDVIGYNRKVWNEIVFICR